MNKCVIKADTNELIAYLSDTYENIVADGFEIVDYGNNEPIFEDVNGIVFVKPNAFEIKIGDIDGKDNNCR